MSTPPDRPPTARSAPSAAFDGADDEVTVDVAESVLGELIGHASAALYRAEHAPVPDPEQIAACRQRQSEYARERRALILTDRAEVRAILERRGRELRQLQARGPAS